MPTIPVVLDRNKTVTLKYIKEVLPIPTRADIWVLDELPEPPPRLLQVGIILESLVDSEWQLLGGKIVDVTVHDPDGVWYGEWEQETKADNWSWVSFMVPRIGTWTFKVSFAGDDEYEPCEFTREITVEL